MAYITKADIPRQISSRFQAHRVTRGTQGGMKDCAILSGVNVHTTKHLVDLALHIHLCPKCTLPWDQITSAASINHVTS